MGSNVEVVNLIVDKTTGEVIDSIKVGDKMKITRGESMEFMSNTVPLPFSSFVKLNYIEFSQLVKELSPGEVNMLVGCINYLGYGDNCVKSPKGRPLNVADISILIGVSRSTANRLISSLLDKDILCKAKNSQEYQLYVCPIIAGRGARLNKVLQTMFRHYRIRSKGNVKWGKLKDIEVIQ